MLVFLIGALLVFGGYFVWTGFLKFLEDRGDITADSRRNRQSTATALAQPTFDLGSASGGVGAVRATYTPLPPCQMFEVIVDRAVYRDCPAMDNVQCPQRGTLNYGAEVCVYARSPENPEWYVIDFNPDGSYREIVFMHESVIEAANPTPTPTKTVTPGPTITPLPSTTPLPTFTPTDTPNAEMSPTATPTLTPSRTPSSISL
jgi:hypothetical protein